MSNRSMREVVARAVSDPGAVMRALGEPCQAGAHILHRTADLTIVNIVWPIGYIIPPHNHGMWAVIGVYAGREDNILWRRLPEGSAAGVEAAGAKTLGEREVLPLGADVIHSVINPVNRLTGAIHIYGGDFYGVPRSEWEPDQLREKPYDMERLLKMSGQA